MENGLMFQMFDYLYELTNYLRGRRSDKMSAIDMKLVDVGIVCTVNKSNLTSKFIEHLMC